MENSFLPQNYKLPDNTGYMKLKDGENTFRIMSSAITGYEYWTNANKPVRSRTPFKKTPDIKLDQSGNPTKIKHFWAFVCWNYEAEAIQILEIAQATIQSAIKAIIDNNKWGDPHAFDLTISRVGEGFDTAYSVMPNPKSDIPQDIKDKYLDAKINLNALYDGANPFQSTAQETEAEPLTPEQMNEII